MRRRFRRGDPSPHNPTPTSVESPQKALTCHPAPVARGHTERTVPRWVLTQPLKAGAHQLHGDPLTLGLGAAEDVAGNQLGGPDHAHGVHPKSGEPKAGEFSPDNCPHG